MQHVLPFLSWAIGGIFLFYAAIFLFAAIRAGLAFFMLGLIFFPFTRDWLYQNTYLESEGWSRLITATLLGSAFAYFLYRDLLEDTGTTGEDSWPAVDLANEEGEFESDDVSEIDAKIIAIVEEGFLTQPCPRCFELEMEVLEFSPSWRSIHYQCCSCEKKMRGKVIEVASIEEMRNLFEELVEEREAAVPLRLEGLSLRVMFSAQEIETYPQDRTREAIPKSTKREVWRRDCGRCVECGSNENLEYDHIIPFSKNGSNMPRNLQLLCMQCNRKKGATI